MQHTHNVNVRLPLDEFEKLQHLARRQGSTVTTIVREAISLILSGGTEADKRRQVSSEFVFLALERWVMNQLPDEHQQLLDEADRRTEALYAAS